MLGTILDSRPARPTRLLAAIAVAACFAVLVGLGIWATAGGTGNDVADPPANRSPLVSGPATPAPTATTPTPPSAAPQPPPPVQTGPATTASAGDGTTAPGQASRRPNGSGATPDARLRTAPPTATNPTGPTASITAGAPSKSGPRGRQPGPGIRTPRPTATGTHGGTYPATLPIQSTTRKPVAPSKVQVSVAGRTVQQRESDGRAYLYVRLRLCGSGPYAWASSVTLGGSTPTAPTAENGDSLSTMPPVWSGERLKLADGKCVNRTTLWLRPSVSDAGSTHTMTVITSYGELRFST